MSKRNVGEIFKRGRIYYIRYYDVRGRRRLETTKSTDKNEAEKQLRKRLSAKDAGVSADAAIGKLTLKEATDDVLNDYKANGRRSLPEVRRKIELHLLPYFGERRRMTSITTADMRAFIAERQREEKDDDGTVTKRAASNAEINRELAALRRAFRLALRAGWLVQPTCADAARAQHSTRVPRSRSDHRHLCGAAGRRSPHREVRLRHGLADRERSTSARMAQHRLGRTLCSAGRAHDEERRGSVVPLYGRHRDDPEGPACRA